MARIPLETVLTLLPADAAKHVRTLSARFARRPDARNRREFYDLLARAGCAYRMLEPFADNPMIAPAIAPLEQLFTGLAALPGAGEGAADWRATVREAVGSADTIGQAEALALVAEGAGVAIGWPVALAVGAVAIGASVMIARQAQAAHWGAFKEGVASFMRRGVPSTPYEEAPTRPATEPTPPRTPATPPTPPRGGANAAPPVMGPAAAAAIGAVAGGAANVLAGAAAGTAAALLIPKTAWIALAIVAGVVLFGREKKLAAEG